MPLFRGEAHIGSLYAGLFRHPDPRRAPTTPPLSASMARSYAELPVLCDTRARRLGRVLDEFARGMLLRIDGQPALHDAPDDRRAAILRFLKYNLGRPIRVADLAADRHLSVSRTSHLRQDIFGQSFGQMLRKERMLAARQLLLTTDAPIAEIARRVGMRDEYHFNRTFRRTVGLPPGRFRRKHAPGAIHAPLSPAPD